MELKAINGSMENSEEKEVRYSVSKDGINREVLVCKVENGYIVTITEDGYKGEGDDKEWYHARQRYISTKDPLAEDDKDEDKDLDLKDVMAKALSNLKV